MSLVLPPQFSLLHTYGNNSWILIMIFRVFITWQGVDVMTRGSGHDPIHWHPIWDILIFLFKRLFIIHLKK
jgi:hypothetical protein